MKIVIAGTGYVGLVTAVSLAHIGHNVICLDVNEKKVSLLKKGHIPIFERDLERLVKENKTRLTFTTNYNEAYKEADVIFISVATPEGLGGMPNLKYVYEICEQISKSIIKDCIVVVKSTVPIGTNEKIEHLINLNTRHKVKVVSNPEFLSQGSAVQDTLFAHRIVVGTEDEQVAKIMEELYKPLINPPYNVPYLLVTRKNAEMIKYASNSFLALKISYINEIANLCEKVGADIEEVVHGMRLDSRIGGDFFESGIGYGGSCFPKDTTALKQLGVSMDIELKTIKACIEANKCQNQILFNKLKKDFNNDLIGKKIAVLGLTFKPNTDDVRESPSILNIKLLLENGALVKAYDPKGIENFKLVLKSKVNKELIDSVVYYNQIDNTIKDCDAALIMTDWNEIKNYNIGLFQKFMAKPFIYDGRNCYELREIEKYKIYYNSIGRKTINGLCDKK